MVIGEPEESRDKVLKSLSDGEWKILAKLADKYQCWTVEKLVESKAWATHAVQGSAELAFFLAAMAGNRELIAATIKRAAQDPQLYRNNSLPKEWSTRLISYRDAQMRHVLECVQAYLKRSPDHGKKRCGIKQTCEFASGWTMIVGRALGDLDLRSTPCLRVEERISAYDFCFAYREKLERHAKALEAEISQWVEFSS